MSLQATSSTLSVAAKTIALPAAIGATVWWAAGGVGVATFSPVGVGLGIVAYNIVVRIAYPFFRTIFQVNPRDREKTPVRYYCQYFATSLASLTPALATIYAIGISTLSPFSLMLETLLFIEGVGFLSNLSSQILKKVC